MFIQEKYKVLYSIDSVLHLKLDIFLGTFNTSKLVVYILFFIYFQQIGYSDL